MRVAPRGARVSEDQLRRSSDVRVALSVSHKQGGVWPWRLGSGLARYKSVAVLHRMGCSGGFCRALLRLMRALGAPRATMRDLRACHCASPWCGPPPTSQGPAASTTARLETAGFPQQFSAVRGTPVLCAMGCVSPFHCQHSQVGQSKAIHHESKFNMNSCSAWLAAQMRHSCSSHRDAKASFC